MNKLTFITVLTASTLVNSIKAYQLEVGTALSLFDSEFVDTTDISFDGHYYFDNVKNAGVLAETAFMQQKSNIFMGINYSNTEFAFSSNEASTSTFSFGGEYFGDFYASGQAHLSNGEDLDTTTFSLEGGKHLGNHFLVTAGFSYSNFDSEDGFGDDNNLVVHARLKKIAKLHNGDHLGIAAQISHDGDADDSISVGTQVDYYLSNRLSVSARYQVFSDGLLDDNDHEFGLLGKYFVHPALSIEAGYIGISTDYDIVFARLAGRF